MEEPILGEVLVRAICWLAGVVSVGVIFLTALAIYVMVK